MRQYFRLQTTYGCPINIYIHSDAPQRCVRQRRRRHTTVLFKKNKSIHSNLRFSQPIYTISLFTNENHHNNNKNKNKTKRKRTPSFLGIPFKLGGMILLFYYIALCLPERWPTAALKPVLSGPEEHLVRRNAGN